MSVTVRDGILKEMLERLESTRRPPFRSQATLLAGPRGVGKSKLLSRFVEQAQQSGVNVVEVHCLDHDDRPHGAIIDVFTV